MNELYIYGMSESKWNGFNWNGEINEVEQMELNFE